MGLSRYPSAVRFETRWGVLENLGRFPCGFRSATMPACARRRFPIRPARFITGRLSWGCSKIASPSTWAACVHSCVSPRMGVGHLRVRASARPCQRSSPVPPSRFLTALMVFSAGCLAGLLRPAADPGVRRVSGRFTGLLSVPRCVPSSPAPGPSKLFPRLQPYPLQGLLPSCGLPSGGPVGPTSGLFSAGRVRCVQAALPPPGARCFLGLVFCKERKKSSSSWFLRPLLAAAAPWGSSLPTFHRSLEPLAKPWPDIAALSGGLMAGMMVRLLSFLRQGGIRREQRPNPRNIHPSPVQVQALESRWEDRGFPARLPCRP